MVRKLVLAFTGLGVASAVAIYLLTIPLLRRLPKPSRVSMDGITTIDDAVEACRRTQLHGWDLVAYAQNLAARNFPILGSIPGIHLPGPLNEVWGTASTSCLR